MSPEKRTPYALALVLCDAVYRDPVTGKNTLLGTFSTVTARSFPATHASLSAYVVLTDGVGPAAIALRVTAAGEASSIAEAAFEVDFEDPRMTFETVIKLNGVVFPAAGEYRVLVSCGDEVLLERRLVARLVGKGGGDG